MLDFDHYIVIHKAIAVNYWLLLCPVVNVCRGTVWRPRD